MNSVDLINALLKRHDDALEQLRLHYGPLIRYVIAPILPDTRDREEVFNDIILRVGDRIDQFDPSHGTGPIGYPQLPEMQPLTEPEICRLQVPS